MENLKGLLRIRVRKGYDLPVRDTGSSDPYVRITMGDQKVKTRSVRNSCDPEWNDELTLAVSDIDIPVQLAVYDDDTFTRDDKMGEADINIKTYIECVKMGMESQPPGTVVKKVHPNIENYLGEISHIYWNKNGKLVQDMLLKLKNVVIGQVEIQIEWIDLPPSESAGTS